MNPTQTTTTTDPTPADVLRRAADHIDRHGFNQGSYYDNPSATSPAVCTDGALRIAAYGEPIATVSDTDAEYATYNTAHKWFSDYLYANLGTHEGQPIGVHAWNDSPHTTGADVVDTLRAAADAWDTKNQGGDRS